MATNDFILDIVEKLKEDNLEYLLVYVQKGKKDHQATALYNLTTEEGIEVIGVTIDEVFKEIIERLEQEDDLGDDPEDENPKK